MASVFTKILRGELPGRFVWKDDLCAAFLSIRPLRPGHTLVVPRKEVDHWIDLEPGLAAHVMKVSQAVGKALHRGFRSAKVGMMVVGLEVPHVHVHLVPIDGLGDMDFVRQETDPDPRKMDEAAETIRESLRALGYAEVAR